MKKVFVAGICVSIIALAAALYFLHGKASVFSGDASTSATSVSPERVASTSPQAPEVRQAPEGSREYHNTAYHFSLFYPQELVVSEHAESGGAMTVTFQNEKEVKGFQLFIVPYAESQVSEARFKQDEPSGVRTNVRTITLDGATGASFNSIDVALKETHEIWFVHAGYLYEVTTFKSFDTWLAAIMQTWKFI